MGAKRHIQPSSCFYLPYTILGKKKNSCGSTGMDDRHEYFIFIPSACFSFVNECRIIIEHDT